jgi:hypothetical protein
MLEFTLTDNLARIYKTSYTTDLGLKEGRKMKSEEEKGIWEGDSLDDFRPTDPGSFSIVTVVF